MASNSVAPMIRIADLEFRYPQGDFELSIPSLLVEGGERVGVIGASGSGKTTLLHLIAGITSPTAGSIETGGTALARLDDADRREFRIRRIGLVFQEFELLEYLDVLDNILLPLPHRLRAAPGWRGSRSGRGPRPARGSGGRASAPFHAALPGRKAARRGLPGADRGARSAAGGRAHGQSRSRQQGPGARYSRRLRGRARRDAGHRDARPRPAGSLRAGDRLQELYSGGAVGREAGT